MEPVRPVGESTPRGGDSETPKMEEKKMTIADAIARYTAQGTDTISPAFQSLVNRMIDSNEQTEFANDSYLDALYLTDVMFGRSKATIRLLTGPGLDQFLTAIKESFLGALKRFKIGGGVINIILLHTELPAWLEQIKTEYESVLGICLAYSTKPIKHFIVCDSKMARLEEIHPPITPDSLATEIKARVYFNEPEKATVFEQRFDAIWGLVEKFEINQRVSAQKVDPAI